MQPFQLLNAAFLSQVLLFTTVFADPLRTYTSHNTGFDKRGLPRHQRRSPISGATVKPAILRPVDEFHPVLGRRSLDDRLREDNLKLSEDLLLQWAAEAEDGTLMRAAMNVTSDDGIKLLFMSRFQGFTESVDCSIRDGDGLSITFKTSEYLELARKQWGWVTEDSGNTFWMITNHKDCSKDDDPLDEYVPYKITNFHIVPDSRTVEFAEAERQTMDQALANFNFDFSWGHQEGATPQPGALVKKRDFFDFLDPITDPIKDFFEKGFNTLKDKFGDAANAIKEKFNEAGNIDAGNSWDINLNLGKEGERSRIGESLLGADKELYCVDCYAKGKFVIAGRVRAEKFVEIKEASFSLSPSDVRLMLKLNVKMAKSDWSTTLIPVWSRALTPFEIPVLFYFGPEISVDLEFGKAINEPIDFETGLQASLPNTAKVSNDLVDDKKVNYEGWDGFNAEVLPFELKSGAVDVDLSLGLLFSLTFGYSIFGIGGHEAAIRAPLPRWTGNFTSTMEEDGACEKKDSAPKIGVNIDHAIGTSLKFYVGPTGMMAQNQQPLVDVELFKMEKRLDRICKGIKSYADDPEFKKILEEKAALEEESASLEDEIWELNEKIRINKAMLGFTEGPEYANMTVDNEWLAELNKGDASAANDTVGTNSTGSVNGTSSTNTALLAGLRDMLEAVAPEDSGSKRT